MVIMRIKIRRNSWRNSCTGGEMLVRKYRSRYYGFGIRENIKSYTRKIYLELDVDSELVN